MKPLQRLSAGGQVQEPRAQRTAREGKNILGTCFSCSSTARRGDTAILSEQFGTSLFEIAPQRGYSNVCPDSCDDLAVYGGRRVSSGQIDYWLSGPDPGLTG